MVELECEIDAQDWKSSDAESIQSCRSDGWVPSHLDRSFPVPEGVPSYSRWAQTLLVMQKYKVCQYTFREACLKAFKCGEMRRYLRFISSKYDVAENTEVITVGGRKQYKKPVTCQAVDLALFLKASRFHEEMESYESIHGGTSGSSSGYRRTYKGLSVNP